MEEAPAWPEDAVEVGRIADAWGVKGWIKVQPFASEPEALLSSRRWFLKPAQSGGPKGPAPATAMPPMLKITAAKRHGDGIVAQAQEIPDRLVAQALKGSRIFVSRASFPTPGPDEYFWVDLIGLTVTNLQGQTLGTVTGLLDTGPHSVLRVAPPDTPSDDQSDERLIPFVAAYILDVSLAERRITVDWGLDY